MKVTEALEELILNNQHCVELITSPNPQPYSPETEAEETRWVRRASEAETVLQAFVEWMQDEGQLQEFDTMTHKGMPNVAYTHGWLTQKHITDGATHSFTENPIALTLNDMLDGFEPCSVDYETAETKREKTGQKLILHLATDLSDWLRDYDEGIEVVPVELQIVRGYVPDALTQYTLTPKYEV